MFIYTHTKLLLISILSIIGLLMAGYFIPFFFWFERWKYLHISNVKNCFYFFFFVKIFIDFFVVFVNVLIFLQVMVWCKFSKNQKQYCNDSDKNSDLNSNYFFFSVFIKTQSEFLLFIYIKII